MRRTELPALTALRFPAAFAIVLYHYFGEMPGVPSWTYVNLSLGVSFFYVLSGFILCYNYPQLTDPKPFWLARFARIWPVHFVTLVITLLVFPWWDQIGHSSWRVTLPANFFLLQAWLPWKGSVLSYNCVSWSLSVEAYFYFMFPWLLVLFRRWGGGAVLTASFFQGLLLVVAWEFFFSWQLGLDLLFPACRLFEFVLGMHACRVWQARSPEQPIHPAHEFLSLGVGLVFVMGLGTYFVELTSSLPVVRWFITEASALCFAWIIWTFAHHAGPISRFLSAPLAVQLGQVSFSLYMVHQIVERILQLRGYAGPLTTVTFFAVYLVISMASAYLLFYLVENPARHWIVNAYRRGSANNPGAPLKSPSAAN